MSESRTKVLHVLPDLAIGGGQQMVLRSAAAMDRDQFESYVCYFSPPHDLREAFSAAASSLQFFCEKGWWSRPMILRKVVEFIRQNDIHIVHVHGTPADQFYGQVAAWKCGLPVVRTLHGMHFPSPTVADVFRRPRPRYVLHSLKRKWHSGLGKFLDRRTLNRVVAVSDAVHDSWTGYLRSVGVTEDHVTVKYNGVPVEQFAASAINGQVQRLRDAFQLQDAYPVLINVGRLSKAKGQDLLVDMMSLLVRQWPAAQLLLVGGGDAQAELEQQIERLGISASVQLVGQAYGDDLCALLHLSDVFVFASHFEGMPLTLLEACAAGTAVVAVDLPGFSRIVKQGINGYLLPDRDADAMAQRISAMAGDRDTMRRMGEAGRQIICEQFDLRHFVRHLEEVYRSVLR